MNDGLSAAVRTNPITPQRLSVDIGRVQNPLATGKRVDTPSDGPSAYFTASALSARAAALDTALDGDMRRLAYDALSSPNTHAEVAGNVTGLTGATAVATAVTLDTGDTIMVSDGTTTAIYSRFGGEDVQDFIDAVNATANLNVEARLTLDGGIQLQATGVTIGSSSFVGELGALGLAAGTTNSTSLLTAGAERPVAADMETEGAMLLALRTRRDLAATSLSLAAEADKTALRLFGVGSG